MGKQKVGTPAPCVRTECESPRQARGLCREHIKQARQWGALPPDSEIPEVQRFDQKWELDRASGCWLWTGGKDGHGYGIFARRGRNPTRAHIYNYVRVFGPVPEGLVLDHFVCDTKACCNPLHLRAVSPVANLTRKRGKNYDPEALAPTNPDCCIHGHEWTPENTYTFVTKEGYPRRSCRECTRLRGTPQARRDRGRPRSRSVTMSES